MIEVKGKCGISAKIVCDSASSVDGTRLTTFEIEYPRIILAELNTHRMLSKNSSSSRAIPFEKMKAQLTGRPVRFGSNKAGMQDGGECDSSILYEYDSQATAYITPEEAWEMAKRDAVAWAKAFSGAGFHKQTFNRLTEPFQMMRTVISGTEWNNFFWLRCDEAADPSIFELASCMKEAYDKNVPQTLEPGQWHLPYLDTLISKPSTHGSNKPEHLIGYFDSKESDTRYELDEAIKVSCARSCAVSFRNSDYGLEKCLEVYERLVGAEKVHSSALEHCASPMGEGDTMETPGVTAVHKILGKMSGNFSGWIQYRQLVEGHTLYG